jgi:hypothetical protein
VIATGSDAIGEQLAARVGGLIVDAANNAPRSLQKRIGPSEVGDPCERKLSYKLLDWPEVAEPGDPIASVLGTSFHAWMEEKFTERQTLLADGVTPRYKIEEQVTVLQSAIETARITGSSDLYDRLTRTVFDWKLVGKSSFDKYRRGGPGDQYRKQGHMYGLGQENAGETPERVAVVFVARYHELLVHVWTEPYDRQVALDALARLARIRARLEDPTAGDYDHTWWSQIPTDPAAKCRFCPWLKPGSTDLAVGCPGVTTTRAGASLEALIA